MNLQMKSRQNFFGETERSLEYVKEQTKDVFLYTLDAAEARTAKRAYTLEWQPK